MKTSFLFVGFALFVLLATVLNSCTPSIPHTLEGKKDCIGCHGQTGVKPYPQWHFKRGYTSEDCSRCHDPKIKETMEKSDLKGK